MLALNEIKLIDRDIANCLDQELDQMKRRRRELKEQAVGPKIQTC